jgi:SAM-dependent methyltransferase
MEHKEYRKLHSEWYELCSACGDHSREIDFWARSIEASGEPALELGSGTGRVLVPLLERGFDIVGIDTSEDMMARCAAACEAKGLRAELHEQSMLELDLPRQFGLVLFASGGLGLFISDQDIQTVFGRAMAHLRPGGSFIYEFEPVPDQPRDDNRWTGDWVCGPDGVVLALRIKRRYDPSSHVWEQLYIVEKFVGGQLVETEANERVGRYFTVDEAVQYAEAAGFEGIRATDWLTEDPPGKDSRVATVQCRKPA